VALWSFCEIKFILSKTVKST